MSSSISQKGQVTVPKALRDRFGLRPGSQVEFYEHEGAIVLRRANAVSLTDFYGCVPIGKSTDDTIRELRGE